MKSRLILSSTICLMVVTSVQAEFQTWTNNAGKTAEMELLGVEEKDGEVIVRFTTRAGKQVFLDLKDLGEADQLKARQWKPGGDLSVKFCSYRISGRDGQRTRFILSFEPKSGNFAVNAPVAILNPVLKLQGTSIEIADSDATFDCISDPFSDEGEEKPEASSPKLEVSISAAIAEADIESCDFSCEIECMAGINRKQVSGFVVPPKEKVGERQQFGPFSVRLVRSYWIVGENGEEGDLASFYAWIDRDPNEDGDQDSTLISRNFVANGKDVGGDLDAKFAGGKVQLKIDYWDSISGTRIQVGKSSSEKGVRIDTPDPFAETGKRPRRKKR